MSKCINCGKTELVCNVSPYRAVSCVQCGTSAVYLKGQWVWLDRFGKRMTMPGDATPDMLKILPESPNPSEEELDHRSQG